MPPMPAEESTPAIVLRTRDYCRVRSHRDAADAQVGKLGGIAKGAKASRRRFERKLEPFSHVMLYFRRRPHGQLVFITRAEAADLQPSVLEDDLGRFALGSYMLELADALTSEEAEAAGAYQVLAEALGALGAGEANVALRQAYELRMFRWAGFGMQFDRCRVCAENQAERRSAAVYFIIGRGGIVCARCRESVPEGGIRLERGQRGGARRTGTDAVGGCRRRRRRRAPTARSRSRASSRRSSIASSDRLSSWTP